jgi:uncharacterized protein (UPF0248 family)
MMKLHNILEQLVGEFNFDGFDKEYHQNTYWSEFEKKFYGELPKRPLTPKLPAYSHREPKDSNDYWRDRRSSIHCASNCPNGLKPLIAVEEGEDFKVFLVINNEAIPLNEVIKNRKENFIVWEHARNIMTDINNEGAAGYRHNVRQRSTYILNDHYKAYKAVIYSVNGRVKKILEKYGFKF